ncbi:MAG TPA: phage holin family protein [Gemmatimonadaceae bacterium]|nr:phage holin family protein [Gemmatimonadaceae bacterium]
MAVRVAPVEPNVTIPELIGRLSDDSKRLARDEVRLAKLEVGESVHVATRGAIWLAVGFGMGVIALVALTVLLAVVFGLGIFGQAWAGALIAGGIDLIVGGILLVMGISILKHTDYTLGESREALRNTAAWISREAAS